MPVMDYVYKQRISLKKKGEKIKDVLTITSKWIWELDVFVCVCIPHVLWDMQIAKKNAFGPRHSFASSYYIILRIINH